jgi:hypothetical protein
MRSFSFFVGSSYPTGRFVSVETNFGVAALAEAVTNGLKEAASITPAMVVTNIDLFFTYSLLIARTSWTRAVPA